MHAGAIYIMKPYRTGKVGGATKLSTSQSNSLERQQIMEFKKRYKPKVTTSGLNRLPGNMASRSNTDSRAELVVCVDSKGDCIGCAGVEGKLYTILRWISGALKCCNS